MDGAADMIARRIEREPRELYVDMGTATDGRELARLARARRDEVRSAFAEGCTIGSSNFMDAIDIDRAWRHTKAAKALVGNPVGRDVIGMLVICNDPRAAGREAWHIRGLHEGRYWITSAGREVTIDLIVDADSLRACVGSL